AQHVSSGLRHQVAADMNPEILLLMKQEQAIISVALRIETRFARLRVGKRAAREKMTQIHLALGFAILLAGEALAVDGTQVVRPAAARVHLGLRAEVPDKADDRGRD